MARTPREISVDISLLKAAYESLVNPDDADGDVLDEAELEALARECVRGGSPYRTVQRIFCDSENCRNARPIAALYVGPTGREILWVSAHRGTTNSPDAEEDSEDDPVPGVTHPALAVELPDTDDRTGPILPAICRQCQAGLLLLPVRQGPFPLGRIANPTWARVVD